MSIKLKNNLNRRNQSGKKYVNISSHLTNHGNARSREDYISPKQGNFFDKKNRQKPVCQVISINDGENTKKREL